MGHQFQLFDESLEPAPGPPPAPAAASIEAPPAPPEAPEPLENDMDLAPEEKRTLLDELRVPAILCERCGLARTRTNVVFGEGNPSAPMVLVGEGPGENEDATGRPFVGRAGRLLDEALARNGITREHVYICNTIKCRAAYLENGRRINRPPTAEEIGACQPWLEGQLGIIRPVVVLCVGAPAANTIIHKGFHMTSERGRWFTTSPYAPFAMAVFHPAYILRLDGPAYEAALDTLVEDIGRARQKVLEVRRQVKAEPASLPPRTLFD